MSSIVHETVSHQDDSKHANAEDVVRRMGVVQAEAAAEIFVELYQKESRAAQIYMSCGCGKTTIGALLAKKSAEEAKKTRAHPWRCIVLVPCIALVKQTVLEWMEERNNFDFRAILICQGATQEADKVIAMVPSRKDTFGVMPSKARDQLDRLMNDVRPTVVFCTYQSSPKLARRRRLFDLGIFDEAHRTTAKPKNNESVDANAGGRRKATSGSESQAAPRADAGFGFALKNSPTFEISKRLFMTATPRTDASSCDDRHCMSDESVYGPVVYRLPYMKAVREGFVVPIRVLVTVMSDTSLSEVLWKENAATAAATSNATSTTTMTTTTTAGTTQSYASHAAAAQLRAVQWAMREHKLQRAITFHGSVKDARLFAESKSDGIVEEVRDSLEFDFRSIDGKMKDTDRQEIMDWYKVTEASTETARKKRVLCSVKCLSEGVDCPRTDLAAVLTPKRSLIDIEQTVGRAIRRAPGKEFGYVLVPLFLAGRKGDNFDSMSDEQLCEAMSSAQSGYATLLNVLHQLQEMDGDVLLRAQALAIKEGKRRARGSDRANATKKQQDKRQTDAEEEEDDDGLLGMQVQHLGVVGGKVEESATEFSKRLSRTVSASVVRSTKKLAWWATLGEWSERTERGLSMPLGMQQWASRQRAARRKRELSEDQVTALDKHGFFALSNQQRIDGEMRKLGLCMDDTPRNIRQTAVTAGKSDDEANTLVNRAYNARQKRDRLYDKLGTPPRTPSHVHDFLKRLLVTFVLANDSKASTAKQLRNDFDKFCRDRRIHFMPYQQPATFSKALRSIESADGGSLHSIIDTDTGSLSPACFTAEVCDKLVVKPFADDSHRALVAELEKMWRSGPRDSYWKEMFRTFKGSDWAPSDNAVNEPPQKRSKAS